MSTAVLWRSADVDSDVSIQGPLRLASAAAVSFLRPQTSAGSQQLSIRFLSGQVPQTARYVPNESGSPVTQASIFLNEALQETRTRQKHQKAEEQRKSEAEKHLANRWAYWQRIHTQRQLCEPSIDKRRRDHLRILPIIQLEERDANGIRFEREPLFRERLTPFASFATITDAAEWSSEQLEALIEGLQKYSGKPTIIHGPIDLSKLEKVQESSNLFSRNTVSVYKILYIKM